MAQQKQQPREGTGAGKTTQAGMMANAAGHAHKKVLFDAVNQFQYCLLRDDVRASEIGEAVKKISRATDTMIERALKRPLMGDVEQKKRSRQELIDCFDDSNESDASEDVVLMLTTWWNNTRLR